MADTVEIDIIARVDQAVSGIQEFVTKLGAAYLSVEAFKKVVIDSFKAYEEAENSQVRLGAALKATGQYSDQAMSGLLGYAKSLQETTIFSHETTEAAAGLLMTIAHLNIDGIQAIMPHLMDFSAMYGVDLPTAARMAAAAIEGGRNGFARYGIGIKEAHTPTEKFNALMDALTKNVGGVSDAMAKTTSGQLTIFKNQINEAKEGLGGFFGYFAKGYMDWFNNFLGGLRQVGDLLRTAAHEAKNFWAIWTDITNLRNPFAKGSTLEQWNTPSTRTQADEMTPWKPPPKTKGPFTTNKDLESISDNLFKQYEALLKADNGWDDYWKMLSKGSLSAQGLTSEEIRLAKATEDAAAAANAANSEWSDIDQTFDYVFLTAKFKKESQELADMWSTIASAAAQFGQALVANDPMAAIRGLLDMTGGLLIAAGARLIAEGGVAMLGPGLGLIALGVGAEIIGSAVGSSSSSSSSTGFPQYANGTDYVPQTGLALLHQGEAVIPPGGSRGNVYVTNHIYGGMWQADDLARRVAAAWSRW